MKLEKRNKKITYKTPLIVLWYRSNNDTLKIICFTLNTITKLNFDTKLRLSLKNIRIYILIILIGKKITDKKKYWNVRDNQNPISTEE